MAARGLCREQIVDKLEQAAANRRMSRSQFLQLVDDITQPFQPIDEQPEHHSDVLRDHLTHELNTLDISPEHREDLLNRLIDAVRLAGYSQGPTA